MEGKERREEREETKKQVASNADKNLGKGTAGGSVHWCSHYGNHLMWGLLKQLETSMIQLYQSWACAQMTLTTETPVNPQSLLLFRQKMETS